MNQLVSIIIPTKNGSTYIARALQSIQSQTYTHWECMVINDGSTDDTAAIIATIAAQDSRLKIISNSKSIGPGASRSLAIRESHGVYIALLDDDDYWSDVSKLEKQVNYLNSHANCALVGVTKALFKNEKNEVVKTVISPHEPKYIQKSMLWKNPFFTSGVVLRKTAYDEVGGFGMGYVAEDYELWLELCKTYSGANIDSEIVYTVRKGSISQKRKISMAKTVLSLIWLHKHDYSGFIPALCKAVTRYALVSIRLY